MFSITNMARKKDGEPVKHEVKALEIIWAKFPKFYSAKSRSCLSERLIMSTSHPAHADTIHVDDLSRNFAMNPQSVSFAGWPQYNLQAPLNKILRKQGLKISAFKNAPASRATDRELFPLAKYLLQISQVEDFRTLNHKKWKQFDGPLPPDLPDLSSLGDGSGSGASSGTFLP